MSSFDPITMATQLATFEIQPFQIRYQRQADTYQAQLSALSSVESALREFRTAITEMNNSSNSIVKNSASVSNEGNLTAEADANAIAGSYQMFVEQLASSHQIVAGMPNDLSADTALPKSGEMTLNVGSDQFVVDFSTLDVNDAGEPTIQSLVKAINEHPDNTGVSASLVRSNGETNFILTSTETGKDNSISAGISNTPPAEDWTWFSDAFQIANLTTLSEPKDAIVRLGGETGLAITSASNTFDNAIEGVKFTVTKPHDAGSLGTTLTVGSDSEATKEQVTAFVDAYNALLETMDKYTAIGSESTERGVLANDSTLRSIESQVSGLLRGTFEGVSLREIGLSFERDGSLSLDTKKLDEAQQNNAAQLEAIFNGDGNLFDSLDAAIDPFLKSSVGLFQGRKDNLQENLSRIEDKQMGLERKYDMAYNRYLAQYTQMNNIMNQMNSTMGMFGSTSGEY